MGRKVERKLQSLIEGEAHFGAAVRRAYSRGAGVYRQLPWGVVFPKNERDIVRLVRMAREAGFSITARGAGSGVAGQAIGEGIVLDFSRFMNRIVSLDERRRVVRVQPGVVQADLNKALKKYGLFFPPDPASSDFCTIGGMIANNSSGIHSVKYGAVCDYLQSVKTTLNDGSHVELSKPGMASTEERNASRTAQIRRQLIALEKINRKLIRKHTPETLKNSSGYRVQDCVSDGTVDFPGLFCSSEGTLGLITSAELELRPLKAERILCLLMFDSLEKAGEAVSFIRHMGPSALEIMDELFLELTSSEKCVSALQIPDNLEALLLVEFESDDESENRENSEKLVRSIVEHNKLAVKATVAAEPEDMAALWALRKAASPILNRLPYPYRPMRFIEDGAVHPDRLVEFIRGLHQIFNETGVKGPIFGHAGDGNIHVNPVLNSTARNFPETMNQISEKFARLIASLNGTLSAEHGDGMLRLKQLPVVFGPLYDVFGEVKRIFDPAGVFNPGKKYIPYPESQHKDIVYGPGNVIHRFCTAKQVNDNHYGRHLFKCNACGTCRKFCPVFKAERNEMESPRSKALIFESALREGDGMPASGKSLQALESLENACCHCGLCSELCPSGVDVELLADRFQCLFPGQDMSNDPSRKQGRRIDNALDRILHVKNSGIPQPLKKILVNFCLYIYGLRADFKDEIFLLENSTIKPKIPIDDEMSGNTRNLVGVIPPLLFNRLGPDLPEVRSALKLIKACGKQPVIVCEPAEFLNSATELASVQETGMENGMTPHANAASGVDRFELLSLSARYLKEKAHDAKKKTGQNTNPTGSNNVKLLQQWINERDCLGFKSAGKLKIVLHIPCSDQIIDKENSASELLKKIPGIEIIRETRECCGMGAAYGLLKKNREIFDKMTRNFVDSLETVQYDAIVTSCSNCLRTINKQLPGKVRHLYDVIYSFLKR